MGRLGKSPAPICIRRPIGWEGFRQNIAVTFGTEKLEWYSYTMVKKMKISMAYFTTIVTLLFDENDIFISLESSIHALQDGCSISVGYKI